MNPPNFAEKLEEGLTREGAPTAKRGQSLWVVLIVLAAALGVIKWHEYLPLFSVHQRLPFMVAIDSQSYFEMAKNGPGQVSSPFTKRVLYPWLAGTLARTTGKSLPDVFMALNLAALLGLAFCLAEILRLAAGKPFLALLFLLTPFVLEGLEMGYIPDLFHVALVAWFFLLLLEDRGLSALMVLLLAFLTRESTLLLCVFTIGLGVFRGKKLLARGAGVVLVAGMAASSFFGRFGKPNMHHLPDSVWQLGKVPYYFLLNIFGLRIWSDVRPDEGIPWVKWHLPSWLKFGADNVVGLAYPDWRYPVSTVIVLLTCFGLGPLILFWLLRRSRGALGLPFAAELALFYGGLSFLLGPLLGDWVDRLVGYGWPAFWIAMPVLFYPRRGGMRPSLLSILAAGYCMTCWWPRFFGYGILNRTANPWPCFAVLLFYLIAWWALGEERREKVKS